MTRCWGITDGSVGMVAQVSALASAMNLQPEMKIIALKKPWSLLPNICYDSWLKSFILSHALEIGGNSLSLWERGRVRVLLQTESVGGETITPPSPEGRGGSKNPDIIISCGRKAALLAAAIKNSQPKVCAIHIQDPQMSPTNFNVVVAMEHDKISGDNVIKTRFALHAITPAVLAEARKKFIPLFAEYPQPHIAVLLGGSTNKYRLTKLRMKALISHLQDWLAGTKGSLLITPSRRTGAENIAALQQVFSGNKNVYIYNEKMENPYMGLLACADEIIVTNDSVNMMSEAFATGKPVTILNLAGHKNTKPARFAEMMKSQPKMTGDEMQRLADEVKNRIG